MDLSGQAEGARAADLVAFEERQGVLDVHRFRVQERYLHEVEPGRGGAGDHTFRPLARPLPGPDKSVGSEGRASRARVVHDSAPLPSLYGPTYHSGELVARALPLRTVK